ncbi:hypothetical protein HanHA300_Chr16g0593951 [Helianthus annuus]|nr:hypothetical protein HanHA300_Chr16g0593951 [Helianthus annuus]KAJ0459026.1 hypothetical protein HanHA89_Chr16g0644281 [Helianthus annuus]KAJ0643538.1 hypothetical protein HanOQP8_Chr16g0601631 [Helianthus annuus]
MENEFYNAFATPINVIQNTMLENETGTTQKPPKLMDIEEYSGWAERFENWVQAYYLDAWECTEYRYVRPVKNNGEKVDIIDLDVDEKKKYKNEKMMVSLLQQAIKEEILILLQHNGSAHSIWKELKSKFVGSKEMIKNKMSLLKKEFDLFPGLKTKNTKQIIERYCNLLMNMKRLNIKKDNDELIEKLVDALPQDVWGTYLVMLKNTPKFDNLTLNKFIEQLEAQEMEQRKIARMKNYDGEQDIGLYYKEGTSDKTHIAPKIETAFNAKSSSRGSSQGSNSKTGFSSYPSFDPNFSATKNGKVLQCNIALNLENDQNYSEEVAKNHMSLLVTVLESYGSLVARRIGNPMLKKEDYDQIDAEEMELMDIKWCLASVLRIAEKFKQITGRDDFRDTNGKGHFKRECTNREASGAQNPFGNNDYYRKAIYHQVAQQPYQQQSTQTAHTRKELEESKKAYLVNQDDGRSSKGFSWDKYISAESKACLTDQDDERLPKDFSWDDYDPNRTADHKAFVAQKVEDDDNDYWANSMKEHLKYIAERDAERDAENARMAKQ